MKPSGVVASLKRAVINRAREIARPSSSGVIGVAGERRVTGIDPEMAGARLPVGRFCSAPFLALALAR